MDVVYHTQLLLTYSILDSNLFFPPEISEDIHLDFLNI